MDERRVMSLRLALMMMILLAGTARAQRPELAATPPLGWNTWYAFGCQVTEVDVKAAVDAMVSNGMKAAGYE
jgi:alpha-galactosidase